MTGSPPLTATLTSLRTARSFFATVVNTAFAGPRLVARDPAAFGAWIFLWFVGSVFVAALLLFGGGVSTASGPPTLGAKFGPYAVVSITAFLLIWAATMVAAFRLSLQPDRRRFFYLDLGADELRFAVMTLSTCVIVAVFAGAPAFLLFAVASPFLQAAPMLAKEIGVVGALATIALDVWVGVRLSLIAVETFAEGRFHLTAYWPLTRGRFWYLLGVYTVCVLMILGVVVVLGAVGGGLAVVQALIGSPQGADPARRFALWALAAGYAGMNSVFWVTSTVFLCGAQAHAFRAITSISPTRRARI